MPDDLAGLTPEFAAELTKALEKACLHLLALGPPCRCPSCRIIARLDRRLAEERRRAWFEDALDRGCPTCRGECRCLDLEWFRDRAPSVLNPFWR